MESRYLTLVIRLVTVIVPDMEALEKTLNASVTPLDAKLAPLVS